MTRKFTLGIKRSIDLTASLLTLFFAVPILIIVAVLVYCFIGKPVLFKQDRPGKDGKTFRLIKFRTMTDAVDSAGELLDDKSRMTRLGSILRSTSLDELPTLWNVIVGDMSLVGPRPLLIEYLPLYTPEQFRRHNMRPGVTGYAQVNGRNSISWEEKFKFDINYIDNWSLRLDLEIVLMTIVSVLKRDGISETGHATMTQFTGSTSINENRCPAKKH